MDQVWVRFMLECEHEHEFLGKEGNGGEHVCMYKSKGMGWEAWVSQIMVMVVRRSFP